MKVPARIRPEKQAETAKKRYATGDASPLQPPQESCASVSRQGRDEIGHQIKVGLFQLPGLIPMLLVERIGGCDND